MKKMKKILALLLCAILLICASVAATVAYLTDTKTVTNTFSVGKVAITLDEAKVNEYGKPVKNNGSEAVPKFEPCDLADAPRVASNTYKLIPGKTYTKDPIIHVDANSENCYLFIAVKNDVSELIDAPSIETQLGSKNWVKLDTKDGVDIYYYNTIATAGEDYPTFSEFKIKSTITNENLTGYTANKTIVVTAYAVQTEGFDSASVAWDNTFGK